MACPRCGSDQIKPIDSKLVYGFKCKKCGLLFDPCAYPKTKKGD